MVDFPRWKSVLTILVIVLSLGVVAFDFYNKADPNKKLSGIKLGLDLSGGSYLVLEANEDSFLQDYSGILFENVVSSLKRNEVSYSNMKKSAGSVTFNVIDFKNFSKVRRDLLEFDQNLEWKIEGSFVALQTSTSGNQAKLRELLQNSIEIIRNRIDQTGTNELSIAQRGYNQIVIELPGVDNPEQIKRIIGTTAKLSFHIVDANATFGSAALKNDYKYVSSTDSVGRYAIKVDPEIHGRNLVDAKLQFQDNVPVVFFMFDIEGGKKFAALTKEQVGNMLAIVLDNKVISAPRINGAITGGSGIITGNFSVTEAQELAILLKGGSLPVPFVVVEERVVGPTLGKESIKYGIIAGILGYALVFIFMLVFYRKLGVVANISILINTVFILMGLSLIGATLTLPGIAGIVLTLGMAVDANILVYERLAFDASRVKASYAMALSNAFKRVFLTITDSNLTTLIAAVCLFSFGSGPVKGFAVTLIIGIFSSIFGIMFVTKLLINILVLRKTKKKISKA